MHSYKNKWALWLLALYSSKAKKKRHFHRGHGSLISADYPEESCSSFCCFERCLHFLLSPLPICHLSSKKVQDPSITPRMGLEPGLWFTETAIWKEEKTAGLHTANTWHPTLIMCPRWKSERGAAFLLTWSLLYSSIYNIFVFFLLNPPRLPNTPLCLCFVK